MQTKKAISPKRRRKIPEGQKHTTVVSFKLSADDLDRVNTFAEQHNMAKSELIRRSLLSFVGRD